jgi:subtilase family protein
VSGKAEASPWVDVARGGARGELRRIRWNRWAGRVLSTVAFLFLCGSAAAETVDKNDLGSMYRAREAIKAGEMWRDRWTGEGVDVALIDTGVVPVDGLTAPGKVVNGPDLSWESQAPSLDHLDTYGHGTHMAGIIAGRENEATRVDKGSDRFLGVAPDARLVNVKVADSYGATDVSQVIAAIDWVVENRKANGLNIRVLNLSYGTDGVQPEDVDPLSHAVETAWRKGIVVVVSAGNSGYGSDRLNNPAANPYVIAVGASDPNGTHDVKDDVVPSWSSRGSARTPDVVAPGKSIVSLRDPGSFVDLNNSGGRYGTSFFRGSGTSQAAAFVSGAAALLIDQRPSIMPDQVKALLMKTARPLKNTDPAAQGAGLINLQAARDTATPAASQSWIRSKGTGSLDAARGSSRLVSNGNELRGELDIFGARFDSAAWAAAASGETAWSGGNWMGEPWTGSGFTGKSWTSLTWASVPWARSSWRGDAWTSDTWTRSSWRDEGWTGDGWARSSWRMQGWSGNIWSSAGWD